MNPSRQFDVRDINESNKRFKQNLLPIQDYTAGFRKQLHDSNSPDSQKPRRNDSNQFMHHVLRDTKMGQNTAKKVHKLPEMSHIAGVKMQYDEGMRDVMYQRS